MKFAAVIATLTFLFSILTKVVGFPAQAKLIFKTKDVRGISKTLYLITFISYILWTIHGYIVNDSTLIWGQGLGVITSGFILIQITYYRKQKQ
ncbi:MAG TPA: SemiSWEET family transporter [Mucilaginibacter sp.]|jgi:uncharacterized protein with PQ loop repeat